MKKACVIFFVCVLWLTPIMAMQLVPRKPKEIQETINTYLYDAVENEKFQEAQHFLNDGAQVNHKSDFFGWTPIIAAISKKNYDICHLLLDHGADIQMLSDDQSNALDHAALRKLPDICDLLITHATFNPRPIQDELALSHNLVFTFLLSLHRVCKNLPKDIRYQLINSTMYWQLHVNNCAFGIHRNHPERTSLMPISVVKQLIRHKLIEKQMAVDAITAHTITTMKPLLEDAYPFADSKKMQEIINPETYETRCAPTIKKLTTKRLE